MLLALLVTRTRYIVCREVEEGREEGELRKERESRRMDGRGDCEQCVVLLQDPAIVLLSLPCVLYDAQEYNI